MVPYDVSMSICIAAERGMQQRKVYFFISLINWGPLYPCS
jgi:hypothetical protein